MILKQIKYFVSVVEHKSFSEAAEECFISQSAISQQIRVLENEIGTDLLKRNNRRFSLTPAGEYFYRQSLVMLDEAERIKQTTLRIANQDNRKIRVGYLRGYGGLEMHNAIVEFTDRHSDIDIQIINGNHEELYDLIRTGAIDIILSDQRRALSDEYVNYHLFSCNCYIEISDRSPLSSLKMITLEELRQVPCILIASKNQEEIEKEYYQKTLGFGGNIIFVENLEEGRILVAGNKGFMPIEDVPHMKMGGGRIERIPLHRNDVQIKREYYAFWRKEITNQYIEEFARILHGMFQKNN